PRAPSRPIPAPAPPAAPAARDDDYAELGDSAEGDEALAELKDESSQKTLEGPHAVSSALAEGEGGEATPMTGARDEVADRAIVRAHHTVVLDGDYFQILGVARDAGGDDIRRAHETLVAVLAPDALHPAVAAELGAELRQIRAVVEEAALLM